MLKLVIQEHVDDPEGYGAVGKRIEYIKTSQKPVKDIRRFILENKNMLDEIDVVLGILPEEMAWPW